MIPCALFLVIAIGGTVAPVPFTTVAAGADSAIEDHTEVVVRSAADWKTLWKKHAPDRAMPAVDFTKSMVVGVFLGFRNSAGYRVTITGVDRDGDDVVVSWREEGPGPNEIVAQMLTFPYHLVRIDRVAGGVKFKKSA
jgi:hypothetical protein